MAKSPWSDHDTDSDASFHSADSGDDGTASHDLQQLRSTAQPKNSQDAQEEPRFPPEEESNLISESNALKSSANSLFTSSEYVGAKRLYNDAIDSCPTYLDYEIAVLRSNLAACELGLREWKRAVNEANVALTLLRGTRAQLSDGQSHPKKSNLEGSRPTKGKSARKDGIPSSADTKEPEEGGEESELNVDLNPSEEQMVQIRTMKDRGHTDQDLIRLKAKSLLRRARAYCELGGWSNLEKSKSDYKALLGPPYLPTTPPPSTEPQEVWTLPQKDRSFASRQLLELDGKIKAAQDKETAEMMSKLKELGNGLLKPFGLSTDSFQMVKDEKTGGYSLNMSGAGGAK